MQKEFCIEKACAKQEFDIKGFVEIGGHLSGKIKYALNVAKNNQLQ